MIRTLYRLWFWIGSWLWPGLAARQAFALFITPRGRVKKPLAAIFEKAVRLELDESGDRCVGWQWNRGGSPRVLILHGFSSSARNFAHLIEGLTAAGADVVAFDAPAHGNSEGKKIHSLRYRKFIQQIRDIFGPFDGYIAHSFGGLSLSLAMEERPPRASDRLVLIAPATETRSALQQLQHTLSLRTPVMNKIHRFIEQRSGHPVAWFSVNRVAGSLNCPILWIHDQQDDITPFNDILPSQERMQPNVRFLITEGLGHRRVYRDAAISEQILTFLLKPNL